MSKTSQTTKSIIDYLNLQGHYAHRNHTTGIKGRTLAERSKYVGDILCCTKQGKWLEIEIKTDMDKLSEGQVRRKEEILKRKGIYLEIKTFDEFLELYVNNRIT